MQASLDDGFLGQKYAHPLFERAGNSAGPAWYWLFALLLTVLQACSQQDNRSYEIRNTSWEGIDFVSGNIIQIDFTISTASLSYGSVVYSQPAPYRYNSNEYQGSIYIEDFQYLDGSTADLIWLLEVAKDTKMMEVNLFSDADKRRTFTSFIRKS